MLTPSTQTATAVPGDINCGDISPQFEAYALYQHCLEELFSEWQHRHTINKRNTKNS